MLKNFKDWDNCKQVICRVGFHSKTFLQFGNVSGTESTHFSDSTVKKLTWKCINVFVIIPVQIPMFLTAVLWSYVHHRLPMSPTEI